METTLLTSTDNIPLVLRVEDLMPILSVGRNTAYDLVRSGQVESFRIGRQLRITKNAVLRYLGLNDEAACGIVNHTHLHGEAAGTAGKE